MHSLVERYIAVATRHLPEGSRTDAARDIRVMIDEMVEARIVAGEDPDVAATALLNELGDPSVLARTFEDQPRYLIGPRHYDQYISLMKVLLTWIPLTAFLALLAINVLTDDRSLVDSFVQGGLDAAWTGVVVASQIIFWVTLTFAIMEWAERSGTEPEPADQWSISDLPAELPQRQIGLGEAAWGIGMMVLTGAMLVIQHIRGIEAFVRNDSVRETLDGHVVPFLNPDIPTWIAVATFGLVLFTAVAEMVKFAVGSWTLPVTIAEIASAIGFVVLPALAISRWGLVNPEIHDIWANDTTKWLTGNRFEQIFLLAMIVISVLSIYEAVRGYFDYRRRSSETPIPGEDFVFIV
jgi:hypothetical protein